MSPIIFLINFTDPYSIATQTYIVSFSPVGYETQNVVFEFCQIKITDFSFKKKKKLGPIINPTIFYFKFLGNL